MISLFLDIETLPGDESVKAQIEADIKHPPQMTKPETIEKWEMEQKPSEIEKKYRDTSLRGHTGRILCVGYIKEGPHGTTEGVLRGDEPAILKEFWELAADVDLFVGFNVLEFDLKYIWQRSVVHRVSPSRRLDFARYRGGEVYDVMQEWEKWGRDHISLDALSRALGIPSPKDKMHGSEVYDYYLAGRLQDICDYCLGDVRATREIYNRMNFLAEGT
ncbi:MAG: putative 3'-5' exonuclease related to the exonuclease domain of PolB [Dehalococcoidia bacterium]|nr:putative 3'-5' exonuclease related to the exonuclease domain of PolB [Dehalococcoidia bacterium]